MRQANIEEWSKILVYIECRKGKIHPVGRELIAEASRLAKRLDMPVYAAAIGSDLEKIEGQLSGCPLERLYLYEAADEYSPLAYEKILADCIKEIKPSIVLIGGTSEGRALAPRLAVVFETGLTADCTSLEIDEEGNLVQIRPAFGGNVMASIVTRFTRPQFATVRPGVMEPAFIEGQPAPKIIRDSIDAAEDAFLEEDLPQAEPWWRRDGCLRSARSACQAIR